MMGQSQFNWNNLHVYYMYSAIDAKNYSAVRKLVASSSVKQSLRKYAIKKNKLSIATLLNTVKPFQPRKIQSSFVKGYVKLFKEYENGDYTAIGNATKLTSIFLKGLLTRKHMIGDARNIQAALRAQYEPITGRDITETVLRRFSKTRQWPHLSLITFPKENRGSCHDYVILQAMMFEKKKQKYKVWVETGLNTMMSHVEIANTKEQKVDKSKVFLLLTLFHSFRTYQVVKYKADDEHAMKTIMNALYTVIVECTKEEEYARQLLRYLLTRRHSAFSKKLLK